MTLVYYTDMFCVRFVSKYVQSFWKIRICICIRHSSAAVQFLLAALYFCIPLSVSDAAAALVLPVEVPLV